MLEDERIKILRKREYFVVKGNELIQKSRFELSLIEQKTVAYICSMIKPATQETRSEYYPDSLWQLEYEFDIRDYCKTCGIDFNNGKNYVNVKTTLKHLADRSMWIEDENSEILVRWLSKVHINKQSGLIQIEIDRDLVPYLFGLQEKFTKYELYNILAMKSAFSVRIYELMKSYAYLGTKRFMLYDLKRLLMVDRIKSYERFPDFRRKILEIAKTEINKRTDLIMSYETITEGRKVTQIEFHIKRKDQIEKKIMGTYVK